MHVVAPAVGLNMLAAHAAAWVEPATTVNDPAGLGTHSATADAD